MKSITCIYFLTLQDNVNQPLQHIHLCMFFLFAIQNGETPLYIASHSGDSDVVTILITNGANVNLACDVWHSHTVHACNCTTTD